MARLFLGYAHDATGQLLYIEANGRKRLERALRHPWAGDIDPQRTEWSWRSYPETGVRLVERHEVSRRRPRHVESWQRQTRDWLPKGRARSTGSPASADGWWRRTKRQSAVFAVTGGGLWALVEGFTQVGARIGGVLAALGAAFVTSKLGRR